MRTYYRRNPETGEVERSPVPFSGTDRRVPVYTDLYMDGARSAEGVDISSRRKREAYKRATNAVDASDFSQTVARGAAERAARSEGRHDDRAITDAVSRAWERHK